MDEDEILVRVLDRMIEMSLKAQITIDAFFPKFGENPIAAMCWSENLFKAVADKQAAGQAIAHLHRIGKDDGEGRIRTLDDVRKIWMTEIRRNVVRVSARSTMATANIMDDRLLQASETVLQILNEEI